MLEENIGDELLSEEVFDYIKKLAAAEPKEVSDEMLTATEEQMKETAEMYAFLDDFDEEETSDKEDDLDEEDLDKEYDDFVKDYLDHKED